ncbi:hypothetical protein PPL_07206 [Heterostelium album PN500]|uniref:Uncharacterized protein n=1 Tax=Heterostelium pallidum (strain ATCC 26659 / Pp 5 / PN500) TaxID=670386 RepID=D3BEP1_HETP5|nr:hypothetical protein PPL_07206 [Heterostelium album PN500]EFA80372.1 hypothetical protein PPL_07206 [Heterostelium album PN500]|eukprot:XP_020432492.1 hypothetical protein PPL_07206 [Heterostelium album PN500]
MPQYTDSEFWDKFVIAYISIRLILLAFRIIDQLSYLFTIPRSGTGSWAWFFGVIGTYFLFLEWMYIGCFWIQLIYTYFVSESINLKNSRRCWITCLVLATLLALWDIGLLIGGMINPASADKFYRVGFIVTLILLGLSILGHGIILAYHLKTQKSRIPGLDHRVSHETRVGNIQNKKNGSPIDREFSSNSSVVSSSSSSPEKIKHAAEVGNLANEINFEILDSGTIDREDIEET